MKRIYVFQCQAASKWMEAIKPAWLHPRHGRQFLYLLIDIMNWLLCKTTTRWRHQMEKFSAILALCAGNSLVTGEFPSQRSVTRSFDVFFDLRLNKRLNKQPRRRWFETPSRPLWRHSNDKTCLCGWYWRRKPVYHRLDTSRCNITRICTQHSNSDFKASVTLPNSRKKPIARPLGWTIGVFRELFGETWPRDIGSPL